MTTTGGYTDAQIQTAMAKKIVEVGTTKVSKHCYDSATYKNNNTFDITYNGLSNQADCERSFRN